MIRLSLSRILLSALFCLTLSACGGGGDSSSNQTNVWDDGSQSANILIWDDGSNADNMKWAD